MPGLNALEKSPEKTEAGIANPASNLKMNVAHQAKAASKTRKKKKQGAPGGMAGM